MGTYVGALAAVAPDRRGDISELAFRAAVNGNIAGFLTACIAGKGNVRMGFKNAAILINLFTRWSHQEVLEDIEIYRGILQNYINILN